MAAALDSLAAPRPLLWAGTDCRPLVIRAIGSDDADLLGAFYTALTPASRLNRFHVGIKELPPRWLQALTHPDPDDELALLAVAEQDGRAACIGEARYALDTETARGRDFAVAVADGWQGHGLGGRLLDALLQHATQRGIDQLHGDVLRDNLPMVALARRKGFAVATHPADARLLRVVRGLQPSWPAPAAAASRWSSGQRAAH